MNGKDGDSPKEETSIVKKLDRSKLHKVNREDGGVQPDNGSVRAIIILVAIIIAVAVGGAFLVKSIQTPPAEDNTGQEETDNQITPTIEVTEEPSVEDDYLSETVLNDSDAIERGATENFVSEDSEFTNEQTSIYKITKISGQPYNSFYRVVFTFETDDEASVINVPTTNLNYRSISQEAEMTFSNTTADESGVEAGDTLSVTNSSLAAIVKSSKSTSETQVYQLKFNDEAKYFAQVLDNQFIIDVLESESVETDASPTPTPSVTEEDESDVDQGGSTSTNTSITSDIAGNDAAIIGFTYEDYTDRFEYHLKLADNNIPNVTSSVDSEGNVIVKITNLRFDALPKDGVGYTKFEGVQNVSELNITNTNNESTYEFIITSENIEYEIMLDQENYNENRIVIKFMH